jgi:hypothetical protein
MDAAWFCRIYPRRRQSAETTRRMVVESIGCVGRPARHRASGRLRVLGNRLWVPENRISSYLTLRARESADAQRIAEHMRTSATGMTPRAYTGGHQATREGEAAVLRVWCDDPGDVITVSTGGQLRAMCAEILSSDRMYPVVGLTCRPGTRNAALPVESVREIIGPRIPIYVVEPHRARAFKSLLPDRHGVFGGAARVWWPGVDQNSIPAFHPLIFDHTGVYGDDALHHLAKEFEVHSPRPVDLNPKQQALLQERLRARVEHRCRSLEKQIGDLQRDCREKEQQALAAKRHMRRNPDPERPE